MNLKNYRGTIVGLVFVILLVIGMVVAKNIADYDSTEKIIYKGRIYVKSINQIMGVDMSHYLEEAKPTGKYSKGMEVYDTENKKSNSTIIFLKTRDERFLIYELSGGP